MIGFKQADEYSVMYATRCNPVEQIKITNTVHFIGARAGRHIILLWSIRICNRQRILKGVLLYVDYYNIIRIDLCLVSTHYKTRSDKVFLFRKHFRS